MWLRISFIILSIGVLLLISVSIIGCYLLKYVYKELCTDHFQNFSEKTNGIVERYRSSRITKAYILQKRLPRTWIFAVLFVRLFLSDDVSRSCIDRELFHQSILLEIETIQGPRFIIIEKTIELLVRDKLRISPSHQMTSLKLSSNKHTLETLLTKTKQTMGNERFFNWRTDSTCQNLVRDIATHLDSSNTTTIVNSFDSMNKEDAYLCNKVTYYYYKLLRMIRLERIFLKIVT